MGDKPPISVKSYLAIEHLIKVSYRDRMIIVPFVRASRQHCDKGTLVFFWKDFASRVCSPRRESLGCLDIAR